MENAVFMDLRRRDKEIYYWKDKRGREVDFLLRQGMKIETAVQVCADPEDEKTNKREVDALISAMIEFDLKESFIVKMDLEKQLTIEDRTINYLPLFEWLLLES